MNRLTPEEAGNKSGLVGDVDFAAAAGGGLGDHAGAGRRGPDDDRVAAAQHAAGGARAGGPHMSLRRLRLGELLALAGAICVIVSLFEPWYENSAGKLSAWDTFGPALVLLIAAAAAALALVVSTVTERSTALPVSAGVWSTLLGIDRRDRGDRAGARAPRPRDLAVRRRVAGARGRGPDARRLVAVDARRTPLAV